MVNAQWLMVNGKDKFLWSVTYLHLVGNVLTDRAIMIVKVEQEVARSFYLQRAKLNGLCLLNICYGKPLAFCDNVLHLLLLAPCLLLLAPCSLLLAPCPLLHAPIKCRLHLIHYIIYSAFAEQGYKQAGEEARQPASLPRFGDVAMAAMLPLPYLCSNEETVEEEDNFMLQSFEPPLPRYLVERKDIDIDALVHLDVTEGRFREARAVHSHLHKVERRMRLCLWCLEEEAVAHFCLCNLGKALIVRTHHAHIDIIVPRKNLSPEVRADSRAARHEVTDAVLVADTLHLAQRLIERILKPA